MSLSNSKKKKIKLTLKMKRCKYCHSTENLTIDHKHPLILGGTDDIKNLQCLCEYCNSVKSGIPHGTMMHLLKWAKHVFDNNEKYLKRFSKPKNMKVLITYEKSNKAMDALVGFIDQSIERIVWREVISFETTDNSPENVKKWLSEERKKEFTEKLCEADSGVTYKVVSISVSN